VTWPPDATTTGVKNDHLLELRRAIAAKVRCLADRELDARLLRLGIETERRQQGASQSAAEKHAKVDPAYVAHQRETARLAEERDRLLAEAEATRFGILLALEDMRGVDA
jgi:hypothetical protein